MAILAGGKYSNRPKTMTQQYMEEIAQKKRKTGRKPRVEYNATVIDLRLQGFTNKEIARITGIGQNYVSKVFNQYARQNQIDSNAMTRNKLNRQMAIYNAYVKYKDAEFVARQFRSIKDHVLQLYTSIERELKIVELKWAGISNRKIMTQVQCSSGTLHDMITRNKLRRSLNE